MARYRIVEKEFEPDAQIYGSDPIKLYCVEKWHWFLFSWVRVTSFHQTPSKARSQLRMAMSSVTVDEFTEDDLK